jgi:hypothetical protein
LGFIRKYSLFIYNRDKSWDIKVVNGGRRDSAPSTAKVHGGHPIGHRHTPNSPDRGPYNVL